jgi:predicted MFS family arabinose efflux permease
VLTWTHHLTIWLLALAMAVFGLLSLFNDAATQAILVRLVPTSLLVRANARLDQSGTAAATLGPATGGALVSWLGAPAAVVVDAASYLASAVLLTRMPVVEPPHRRRATGSVWREAGEGLRWVYGRPVLRALALGTHAWFAVNAVATTVVVTFALSTLHFSALALGLATSVSGLGGLAGASLAVRLGLRFGAGHVIVSARMLYAVAWALIAAAGHGFGGWVVFAAGQLLYGFGLGVENASEMGYRQAVTPDRLQGRTNATMRSFNRAMIVIAAPLGGLLADRAGNRTTLVATAVGFALVAAAMGASRMRNARIPT